MSFIGAIVTMEGRVFGVSIMCTCVVRLFELLITNHDVSLDEVVTY